MPRDIPNPSFTLLEMHNCSIQPEQMIYERISTMLSVPQLPRGLCGLASHCQCQGKGAPTCDGHVGCGPGPAQGPLPPGSLVASWRLCDPFQGGVRSSLRFPRS